MNEKWEAAKFKPGQSGNPAGGCKGGRGRSQVLLALDLMLGEEKSQATMINALRRDMEKDPVRFFKEIVMPLLPKETHGTLDAGGRVLEWRGLLSLADDPAPKVAEAAAVPPEIGDGGPF